jgi:hypothetical protein
MPQQLFDAILEPTKRGSAWGEPAASALQTWSSIILYHVISYSNISSDLRGLSRHCPRQTWSFDSSTDLDESDIDQLTGLVASTIPDRNPVAIDYAYGDPREVTAATESIAG